jgi:hypothetical protein
MSAPPLNDIIEALPHDIRERLEGIRAAGRGAFCNATTQQIVDNNIEVLLRLRSEHRACVYQKPQIRP